MMAKRPGAFDAWVIEEQDQGVDWSDVNAYNDMTKNGEGDEGSPENEETDR